MSIEFINNSLIIDANLFNKVKSLGLTLRHFDLVAITFNEGQYGYDGVKIIKCTYFPYEEDRYYSFADFKKLCEKYII